MCQAAPDSWVVRIACKKSAFTFARSAAAFSESLLRVLIRIPQGSCCSGASSSCLAALLAGQQRCQALSSSLLLVMMMRA